MGASEGGSGSTKDVEIIEQGASEGRFGKPCSVIAAFRLDIVLQSLTEGAFTWRL